MNKTIWFKMNSNIYYVTTDKNNNCLVVKKANSVTHEPLLTLSEKGTDIEIIRDTNETLELAMAPKAYNISSNETIAVSSSFYYELLAIPEYKSGVPISVQFIVKDNLYGSILASYVLVEKKITENHVFNNQHNELAVA